MIALLRTTQVIDRIHIAIAEQPAPAGVKLAVFAPGETAKTEQVLLGSALGASFPGWQMTLAIEDDALFQTTADRRARRYLFIGCAVVAAVSILAMTLARSFRKEVRLAQLKNDLVANVSHELKTPLTAMRALVDTLLEKPQLEERSTREYLGMLATENARLSRLIENFLTFSRLERGKLRYAFRALDPRTVVDEAVAALGERVRSPGCSIETKVAPDLPAINGDPDALATALLNLLDNACKYSGEEKRIVVCAERCNGVVRFAVSDNGAGPLASRCAPRFRPVLSGGSPAEAARGRGAALA